MTDPETYDKRLDSIVNLLIRFGQGEFDAREALSDNDDPLNTVITGLNMLGEELSHYKEQLAGKTAFLENIIGNVSEIIYVLTFPSPGIFSLEFVSPQVHDLLGYTPEELQDNFFQAHIHPDDLPQLRLTIAQVAAGRPSSCQYRVRHKTSEEYVWLEDKLMPKHDESGKVVRIFGSARDVTKKKIAEDRIREAEQELEAQRQFTESILNNLPADIAVFDQEHRYIFINRTAVKNPELREWLIGKDDFDYCRYKGRDPELARFRRECFEKVLSSGQGVEWVDENENDGEKVYTLRRNYPHYENGELKYVIGYGFDYTKLKKAEEERERLIRELSHKYNELMQFNYIVSHNLRAPVTRILGMANLLKMSPSAEECERINNYMVRSAETIDVMIKDLSVILATRSPLNEKKEIFRLSDILASVNDNLETQIRESSAVIRTEISERADTLVSLKSYIQSAVFNLVSNAIKYKSNERPLQILLRAERRDGATIIEVQDNGMGIDLKAHGEYIFGLYKRFNTEIEGKGLGLHMTKAQVESLGGSITVASEPERGTTFTIILPDSEAVLRVEHRNTA